jgi:dipeptidyl aminopeptidase/acylaminoacyl peptidase
MRAWPTAAVVVALLAAGCDTGGDRPADPRGSAAAALVAPAPSPAGAVQLADVRRIAGGGDEFLVTPRWAPTGDRLLVSGYLGVGLGVVDLETLALRWLDTTHIGRALWSPDGRSVAQAVSQAQSDWLLRDPLTGEAHHVLDPSFVPRRIPNFDETADGEVLYDANGRRTVYEEYRGRVVAWENGRRVELEEDGGAGPRVSPDGRRVAWWTGHLVAPLLHVADVGGRVLFEGAGAHAAWLPDGERVVFADPLAGPGQLPGSPRVAGSELRLLDLRTGIVSSLTETPDATEMEPAVSPDGSRLAFADWETGTIWIGRVADAAATAGGAP